MSISNYRRDIILPPSIHPRVNSGFSVKQLIKKPLRTLVRIPPLPALCSFFFLTFPTPTLSPSSSLCSSVHPHYSSSAPLTYSLLPPHYPSSARHLLYSSSPSYLLLASAPLRPSIHPLSLSPRHSIFSLILRVRSNFN